MIKHALFFLKISRALFLKLSDAVASMESAHFIHALDLFGVSVASISGTLVAGRKRMDIFGVVVLGLVTAIGGGTLRDLVMGATPVFWLRQENYLFVSLISSLATFIWIHFRSVSMQPLLIADAIGLAAFTIVGTSKALAFSFSPTIAVFMGVLTGIGGGAIRDVLAGEVPFVLRREIYATASLSGAIAYLMLPSGTYLQMLGSFLITFIIRLIAVRFDLSLPKVLSKNK